MNETPKTERGWRIARHIFIALAVLATLIAVFYTEEDWRGKRAWENCKRELEAQGVALDWNKFLPPNVPDDQNFYTASTNILQKFKQLSGANDPDYRAAIANSWLRLEITKSNTFPILDTSRGGPIVIAKMIVSLHSKGIETGSNTLAVAFNDPGAPKRIGQFIQATMGETIYGAQGFEFSQFQLTNLNPAKIFIQAGSPPSVANLTALIPSEKIGRDGRLRVAPTADPQIFQVQLANTRITAAADYIKWSDQFVPAFDDIREALKRPYAILPGDYSNPAFMPIPNFVLMRALAQTLGQRAQCYFLLGEPDKALHELTLIHDVCRILEKPPTGQPETLVEAMINTAIMGLYVAMIEEGLQRHAWQEPQLIALQEELNETDLCPFLYEALREGPAHITRVVELATPPDWGLSRLVRWPVPRGWMYQMMVVTVKLEGKSLIDVNLKKNVISPKKLDETMQDINTMLNRHSPFNLLARIAIPNELKAWQTTAYNQTLVNEAQIACALERYHVAHGEYPETLDALAPQFIETIPHDLIGGQPLLYRRTEDGKFLLYSVGWNETDDGGQKPPHLTEYTQGDWVWGGLTDQ